MLSLLSVVYSIEFYAKLTHDRGQSISIPSYLAVWIFVPPSIIFVFSAPLPFLLLKTFNKEVRAILLHDT